MLSDDGQDPTPYYAGGAVEVSVECVDQSRSSSFSFSWSSPSSWILILDSSIMSKSARKSVLPSKPHGYEFQGP